MSLSDDVKTVLEADDDLMDILTGGIYTKQEVGEISRQNTPDAFDANGELLPCALVITGTEIKRAGIDHPESGVAVQTPVMVYYYERSGYANIAAAMDLAFPMLNGQKIGTRTWRVEYDNTIPEMTDQALDCPLGVQQFVAIRRRV